MKGKQAAKKVIKLVRCHTPWINGDGEKYFSKDRSYRAYTTPIGMLMLTRDGRHKYPGYKFYSYFGRGVQ